MSVFLYLKQERFLFYSEAARKSHKKAAIIVFDKENREFTNVLTDYMSRK